MKCSTPSWESAPAAKVTAGPAVVSVRLCVWPLGPNMHSWFAVGVVQAPALPLA